MSDMCIGHFAILRNSVERRRGRRGSSCARSDAFRDFSACMFVHIRTFVPFHCWPPLGTFESVFRREYMFLGDNGH